MAMSEISVQELKARLSSAIAKAEAGQTLVITRHRSVVAQLALA
jgi:antitoxin (DNA-binding transcriptional repressor) of toxin-antitoxin stability system